MSTISAGTTSTTTLVATGDTTGSLVFKTNDTGSGGTTAMTIDTSQNVGIGTSSPTYRLDAISTGGTQTARFRSGDTATTVDIASFERSDSAVRAVINYNSSDGAMTYGTSTNHPIAFKTNNTERARIDTSGNFLFNSGYGSVATAYGCRAWVNFNGTGTVAIRASGNVSSITDNGTGLYVINFTNAMSDANYSSVVSFSPNFTSSGSAGASIATGSGLSEVAPTTTTLAFATLVLTASGSYQDPKYVSAAIFR